MARLAVPRLAVLWCPHWPVVVAGAAAGEPVAVLHANRVVACSLAATADGIGVGTRRREAQARCPELRLVAHDPDADARAFQRVARAVGELVPRLELTEPGMLAFAARGPARYFGGEAAMAARIAQVATAAAGPAVGGVEGFGMGIADGRFAATVAARRAVGAAPPLVVAAGRAQAAAFLAPLPVSLLVDAAGVDADFVGLLRRLGLVTLGDLAALPPTDLEARFGPLGAFSHRVAAGGDDRLPGTYDPPAGREVQRVFDEPVHHSDVLVFVARQLVDELVSALAADGRVCTRVAVRAETEHGERSDRVWQRSTGLAAASIVERVRWQLDAWAEHDTLTAGVVLLRIEPVEVRADDGVQQGLWGGRTQADDWAVRAVARLTAIAGEEQVVVPAACGGRHPQEVYRWVPASTSDLHNPDERLRHAAGPWPGRLPTPAPAVVHQPALPIDVADAQGATVRVSGRGVVSAAPDRVAVEGRRRRIVAWGGPWPVDERWWDRSRARRVARFQLLTDDDRLLLAGVEDGRWWLAAEYD